MFNKIIGLFAIIQSIDVALSVCNGIEFTEGLSLPPDACFAQSESGEEVSYKFSCTGPTAYQYDNGDCSGTAVNSSTDIGTTEVVCGKDDCPVVIVKTYEGTDNDCTATGDYTSVPLAIGCAEVDSTTSFNIECSEDQLTQNVYSSSDCSGDVLVIVNQKSGCDEDDGVYTEFTCAAAHKYIGITMLALFMTYLFNN
mmetsp:Transcript_17400/g.15618  ORF Transcript_17400/g.15618 Transcript_17400/m.15618 type:complete len:197 (-) Transcript_17400:168-758(-)